MIKFFEIITTLIKIIQKHQSYEKKYAGDVCDCIKKFTEFNAYRLSESKDLGQADIVKEFYFRHVSSDVQKIDFILGLNGGSSNIYAEYMPNNNMNFKGLQNEMKDSIKLRLD